MGFIQYVLFTLEVISLIIYILIFIGTLIIDQLTKALVQSNMYNLEVPIIKNIFSLTYVENYGAAWGILSDYSFILKILPVVFSIIILIYLVKYKPGKIENICGILVISGAIGNFIDRIRLGYVIDFIDVVIFNYDYPVFNLADTFIVIGVIFLFISIWRDKRDGI